MRLKDWAAMILGSAIIHPTAGLCQITEGPVSETKILILSRSGEPIPAGRLTVSGVEGKLHFSGTPRGEVTVFLPYGKYVLKFSNEMVRPTELQINVGAPNTLAIFAVDIDLMHVQSSTVSVSIRSKPLGPCSSHAPIWARLSGVYSDFSAVTEMKLGYALFDSVEPGAYVLVVVEGRDIRGVFPLNARGSSVSLELPLNSCPTRE